MRGEDRTRYLRYVDGKRGGRKKRKKGKEERRRLFLPGVMEFIYALCLRLSFVR